MILGIGAGDRPLLALGMRPARLASIRASIGAIRELWSGADVSVEDAAFELHDAHLRFAARPDIPVYVSASGPKTLELAGEIADGVILLVGLFPEGLAWALEHVDRGAAKAGRPRPHVAVFAYGAIDDDAGRGAWRRRARSPRGSRRRLPTICELAGAAGRRWSTACANDTRAGSSRRPRRRPKLLPDEFVRRVALAGDAAHARGRIEAVATAGADSVHVFPLGRAADARRSRRSPRASPTSSTGRRHDGRVARHRTAPRRDRARGGPGVRGRADVAPRLAGRTPRRGRGSSSGCTRSVASYVQTLEADGEGVVQRFLEQRGPGLHHMAFVVDAIDAALADLDERGVPLIDRRGRDRVGWGRGSRSCIRRRRRRARRARGEDAGKAERRRRGRRMMAHARRRADERSAGVHRTPRSAAR